MRFRNSQAQEGTDVRDGPDDSRAEQVPELSLRHSCACDHAKAQV